METAEGYPPTSFPDRRARRRQETVEEILDAAVEVMAEDGVAGLSLSEVARRVGMRQPSLYKYFPSKLAVYDALFARGARQILGVVRAAPGTAAGLAALEATVEAMLRWGLEHREVNQLLFTREVPGFAPSHDAYAPAVELVEEIAGRVRDAVDRGQLRPEAASQDGLSLLSVLVAGVAAQQLANQPDTTFEQGRYTRLTPRLMTMFAAHYAPDPAPPPRLSR